MCFKKDYGISMDGKIKKTFKNSHYSWWRSKAFDIKKAKTIEL